MAGRSAAAQRPHLNSCVRAAPATACRSTAPRLGQCPAAACMSSNTKPARPHVSRAAARSKLRCSAAAAAAASTSTMPELAATEGAAMRELGSSPAWTATTISACTSTLPRRTLVSGAAAPSATPRLARGQLATISARERPLMWVMAWLRLPPESATSVCTKASGPGSLQQGSSSKGQEP